MATKNPDLPSPKRVAVITAGSLGIWFVVMNWFAKKKE